MSERRRSARWARWDVVDALAHGTHWPWAVVVVVLLGTSASNNEVGGPGQVVLSVLLAVTAALPAVLRLGPGTALLVSGAATGGYFAAGFADGPVFLALPTVALVVASRHPPRAWLGAVGRALALALVGLVVRGAVHEGGQEDLWQFVGLLGVTAAAAALTTAIRSRQDATRDRTERAATEERLRMAQDLHDGVGHGLAVIAMQAGVGLHVLDRDPAKARESLEAIRATSTEALEALRAELAQMSGGPAIRRPARGYADVAAVVERVRAAGLSVEVRGDPGTLDDEAGRVVHAVVQESLTNVLRHAGAGRAVVEFEPGDGTVVLTVSDDGRGRAAVGGSGMGIDGMRTRVEGLGGRFQAGPGPSGFRVRAEIPT